MNQAPDEVIRLEGTFYDWQVCGEYFYALTMGHSVAHMWKWSGDSIVKVRELSLREFSHGKFAVVSGTTFLRFWYQEEAGDILFRMGDIESERVTRQWRIPWRSKQEMYEFSSPSSQGRYIAVWGWGSDERQRQHILRVGLVDVRDGGIFWAGEDMEERGGELIRSVKPSEEGKYIGVAGWALGTTMVDVEQQRVLWKQCPEDEVCSHSLAFTPDSKLVYAGGVRGAVYEMEVATGKVLRKWWPSVWGERGGKSHVDDLCVSPDGKWVAACLSPSGRVVVFARATGQVQRVLVPGGDTIGFSPDSRYLGAASSGAIRIWKVQE